MKQKKRAIKPYGLRARFAVTLILSALLCSLVFLILYTASNYYIEKNLETPEYLNAHMQQQGKALQDFIVKNDISSKDLSPLKKWEARQPTVLLELYADGERIYRSSDDTPRRENPPGAQGPRAENTAPHNVPLQNEEHTVLIHLTDIDVQAVIFSDTTYQYYVLATALSALVAIVLFVLLYLLSTRKLIRYVCRLNEEVQILEGGNLDYEVSVEGNDELTDLANSMNRMRVSFRQQLASENALHRANKRLVTEMSHDLRTPLTGIMLYLEVLRSHRYETEEELQEYLEKIDAKARHMKQISDHLFAYTLKELPEQSELQTAEQAFSDAVAAFVDDLKERGFRVVSNVVWSPCFVQVNGEYLQRILENGVSNIEKYADPSEDVILQSIDTEKYCGLSVVNACAASETPPESSGIGIKSIRTMMQQMNGQCTVEQTETAFEIALLFPKL
ncbi:MAG: HAMP domain-containing histidine kinase [Oscillospiraceae bacterium]|nr:HAMP domain-containing histidine kinase [Oscillospiraceae bacterium]